MHERDDEPPAGSRPAGPWPPTAPGALVVGGGQPVAGVRLRREFKGLTVEELVADVGIHEQLPGRVQSALDAITRGDLPAALEALPGRFGAVLPGPGHRPASRARRVLWIVLAALAAAALTATISWVRSR